MSLSDDTRLQQLLLSQHEANPVPAASSSPANSRSQVAPTGRVRLLHLYHVLQLPPYSLYPTLKKQWTDLSRPNQTFLIIIPLLWPLSLINQSWRLMAPFLPLLALPFVVVYQLYQRFYNT
jgi:hypothetical protein